MEYIKPEVEVVEFATEAINNTGVYTGGGSEDL